MHFFLTLSLLWFYIALYTHIVLTVDPACDSWTQHEGLLVVWLVSSGQLVTTLQAPAGVNSRHYCFHYFGVIEGARSLMPQSLVKTERVLVQVWVWSLSVWLCRDVVHRTRRNPHSAQFVWETVVEAFYPRLRFVNKTKMFPQNQTRDSRWAKIKLHGRLTWYFCP